MKFQKKKDNKIAVVIGNAKEVQTAKMQG